MIVVDSLLPKDQQEKALKHELAHLSLDHLNRIPPKDTVMIQYAGISETWEAEADRYAEAMTHEEYETLMRWAI